MWTIVHPNIHEEHLVSSEIVSKATVYNMYRWWLPNIAIFLNVASEQLHKSKNTWQDISDNGTEIRCMKKFNFLIFLLFLRVLYMHTHMWCAYILHIYIYVCVRARVRVYAGIDALVIDLNNPS